MKQKDIALILVIVIISAIVSFLLSGKIFSDSKPGTQTAETILPITSDFPRPDSKYFNSQSIDPTKTITIGQNTNADPFNSPTN